MGPKVSRCLQQAMQVPAGIPLWAEEVGSHVIIDSDDGLGALIEVADQLGTDQSAGTRD